MKSWRHVGVGSLAALVAAGLLARHREAPRSPERPAPAKAQARSLSASADSAPVPRRAEEPRTPIQTAALLLRLFAEQRRDAQRPERAEARWTSEYLSACRERQAEIASAGCELGQALREHPAAWPPIVDLLAQSPDASAFESLASLLPLSRAPEAEERWRELLRGRELSSVRARAAGALSTSVSSEGLQALLDAFEADPDPLVREAALRSLLVRRRDSSSPQTAGAIEEACRRRMPLEENGSVKALAASMLPENHDPRVRQPRVFSQAAFFSAGSR